MTLTLNVSASAPAQLTSRTTRTVTSKVALVSEQPTTAALVVIRHSVRSAPVQTQTDRGPQR